MANALQGTSAYNANVEAAALNAIVDEYTNLFWTDNLLLRLLVGDGKDTMPKGSGNDASRAKNYRGKIRKQDGGDYARLVFAKQEATNTGRGNTGDPYTQSSEDLLDKALWPFVDIVSRMTVDRGEKARAKGYGGQMGMGDYMKAMAQILIDSSHNKLGYYNYGYGYVQSSMLGATTSSGRGLAQGLSFMCDGPTDNINGITAGTGNGNKDGTDLNTSNTRMTMTATNDRYYGGLDRDLSVNRRWRGNHSVASGALTYRQLSQARRRAVHGRHSPKFALTSKLIEGWITELARTNQRVGLGENLGMGDDHVIIDRIPVFADEVLDFELDGTVELSPFKPTAAGGGKFFQSADVTAYPTNSELVEMAEQAVYFINPDWLWVVALSDMCAGDGTPTMEAEQASQVVIGTILTLLWSYALCGVPRYHSVLSTIATAPA